MSRTARQGARVKGQPAERSGQFKERGDVKRPLNAPGTLFEGSDFLTLQRRSPSTTPIRYSEGQYCLKKIFSFSQSTWYTE